MDQCNPCQRPDFQWNYMYLVLRPCLNCDNTVLQFIPDNKVWAKMSTSKCSHSTAGESGGSQPTGWPGWVVTIEGWKLCKIVQMRAIAQHLADSDYDLVLLQVDRIYLEYQKYPSNLTCWWTTWTSGGVGSFGFRAHLQSCKRCVALHPFLRPGDPVSFQLALTAISPRVS